MGHFHQSEERDFKDFYKNLPLKDNMMILPPIAMQPKILENSKTLLPLQLYL